MNADGKLVLGANDDDNYEKSGGNEDVDMAASASGANAYVEAITGKDAFKRGQRNRVKFSNKRSKDEEGDEDMEDDDHTDGAASAGYSSGGKRAKHGKKEMSGRDGLGVKGVKEGRVRKGQGQKRGGRGK